jgi:hypothetical protein
VLNHALPFVHKSRMRRPVLSVLPHTVMGMDLDLAPPAARSADALLDDWRTEQDEARHHEVRALEHAIAWLTRVAGTAPADQRFSPEMPIGGEGCPAVPEDAVAEFAAVAGMTIRAARSYLADAWDLQWRFPETHAVLREGTVEVWRARQAVATLRGVRLEAAQYVDQRIAPVAHLIGPTRLRQLVILAEILSDPDAAVARARAATETRGVDLHPSLAPDGLTDLVGRLDHADAQDLEAALQLIAAELGAAVPEGQTPEPLDVRRAKAVGVMARRQLAGASDPEAETRVVHTYVHLTPASPVARIEKSDLLVPVDRVKEWCRTAGTKVIIRPVLDLTTCLARDGYLPSEEMREQAIAINRTCVHPHCTNPARACDLDHIDPYRQGGPPGQTSSTNLAPLCRLHHRLKTHSDWSYTRLEPGYYLWRSPRGRHYLRTPTGTTALAMACGSGIP